MTPRARIGLLVAALTLGALAPPMVGRELMPPDEPRFALVAREMLETGDAVVLRRGGERYTDKPPLLFWLAALCFRLAGGTPEWAARLPSLGATLGTVLLLEAFVRRRSEDDAAGLRVAAVYVGSSLVLQRGAWVAPDALLSAATFASVVLLARLRERREVWHELLLGAALAAGVLAKGPVALVLIGLAWLAGRVSGTHLLGLRPLIRPATVAAFAAAALPWPVAWALREGAGPLLAALWRQNVTRYVASWDNLEPWWYFGPALVLGLLPWSLPALASAATGGWRRATREPLARWAGAWLALCVLFFSIPSCKRGVYLLPCWPAAAILVERLLDPERLAAGARRAAAMGGALIALVALALAGAVAAGAGPAGAPPLDAPRVRAGALVVLVVTALGAAGLAAGLLRARRAALAGPALAALALGLLAPPVLTPALNEAQRARAFATAARAAIPDGSRVAMARKKWELVAWYGRLTGPHDLERDALLAHLAGPPPAAAILPEDALPPRAAWPEGTELAHVGRIGRLRLAVLVRRAPARPVVRALSSTP